MVSMVLYVVSYRWKGVVVNRFSGWEPAVRWLSGWRDVGRRCGIWYGVVKSCGREIRQKEVLWVGRCYEELL